MNKNFLNSQKLLKQGELVDAWAATRVKNYYSIEGAYPIYGSHAKGAYLWDVDGNKYVDFTLGYGTVVLGHADKRVNEAAIAELNKGSCISPLWKPIQVELTKQLTSVIPNAERAFLMKTGSDATSGAVRLARIFTGRNKIVRWGYNGWHDWSTPLTNGVPENVLKDTLTFQYNNIDSLREIFERYPNQIACVLMMPFEIEKPTPNFLESVRNLAHEYSAIFILDEMRSGFRLSLGGAQEFFGVKADLATYSKSMSNGYPISAIVGRADILQCMESTKMTATYFTSASEMAAALSTISILKKENTIQHIWNMGTLFQTGIQKIINEYEIDAECVGYPPYPYIRFTSKDMEKRQKSKEIFFTETTKQGVFFHPGHHWYICGAHSKNDIEFALAACEKAFLKTID